MEAKLIGAKLIWTEGMRFQIGEKTDYPQGPIYLDANADLGIQYPNPKQMLLMSLLGCTGMDVVALLTKMRQPFTRFNLQAVGELNDEHPIHFKKIFLTYNFVLGEGANTEKFERAVELSTTKYCGIHHMIEQACEVNHEIKYY